MDGILSFSVIGFFRSAGKCGDGPGRWGLWHIRESAARLSWKA